jgi:pyruvate dehydrogenase E1 component beta subunit
MMHETLAAADLLAERGTRAEVIDVATLRPLDMDTILASVEKTGRCVIVHEAAATGGFGGEIAGVLAEHGLMSLLAPISRITGYDTIVPLPANERHYMPSERRIVEAARQAAAF